MRIRSAIFAFALSLVAAGAAHADKFYFTGTHAIRFTGFGGFTASATGSGVAVVNNSSGSGGHLVSLQFTKPFNAIDHTHTVLTGNEVLKVQLTGVKINPTLQGGIFAPIGATLTQSTMPGAGQIKLCKLIACGSAPGSAITIPLTQTLGTGTVVGPGVGGTFTVMGPTSTTITVSGAPWTVGTVVAQQDTGAGGTTTETLAGFHSGPASNTSSTATQSGMIQLVTATRTLAVGLTGPNSVSGQLTRLTIHFTPEPGLLLLLGSGSLGLALLGHHRRRR